MNHMLQIAANDNAAEPTGVERCGSLLVVMAGHPQPEARFMLAVTGLTDLSLQNDEDGFHIAADAVEDMLELKPWDQVRAVKSETGVLAGFEAGLITGTDSSLQPSRLCSSRRSASACVRFAHS